jgi:hypothetical protein
MNGASWSESVATCLDALDTRGSATERQQLAQPLVEHL